MEQLNTGELTQEAVKELYTKEQEQLMQEPPPEQGGSAGVSRKPHQSQNPTPNTVREATSDNEPQEKAILLAYYFS